jgi:hypothetical protein
MVIAIAIDENTETIRGLADGITYPVLMDPDHVLTELYAVSNVPSVIWIDENDRIARPNAGEFGTDMFSELTGIEREGHFNQIRAWVADGTVPDDATFEVADLDDDEVAARLHFRLAAHLRRAGDDEGASSHFDTAAELAPYDFTIVRAAMPLRGADPFGEEFMALYKKYNEAGRPFHGIPRAPR